MSDKVQYLRDKPKLVFKGNNGFHKMGILGDHLKYVKDKIDLNIGDKYVSTENINKDFSGVYPVDIEKTFRATQVNKGYILMSNIRPYLRKIEIAKFNGGCSSDVLCFDSGENDSRYFKYLMQKDEFIDYVMNTSKGTKMPRGDKNSILKYKISIPSITLQAKIADSIDFIDRKIKLSNQKIDNLELFKKGYKNDLIRNLNDNNSKIIRLKEILTEVSNKTTYNNQHEILSSTKTGVYKQSEYFNHQVASKDNTGYKILRKNQMVISPQNAWMGNYNINTNIELGIVSPSYKIFDIYNIIPQSLFSEFIDTDRFRYNIVCSSEQGASIVRRNLNLDDFLDIEIKVPRDKKELESLDGLFKNLNKKILILNDDLENLKLYKKGLLQQMFI